jgi:carbon starvation protein
MAFSTFVFDTLDVATRLGRYILQELTGHHGRASAVIATAVTAFVPLLVLSTTGPGGYRTFWILFGTSNQLLAALTLLAVTVWLKRSGRAYWFTAAPTAFMLAITLWALAGQALQFWGTAVDYTTGRLVAAPVANAAASILLFVLAALLAWEGARALRSPSAAPGPGAALR